MPTPQACTRPWFSALALVGTLVFVAACGADPASGTVDPCEACPGLCVDGACVDGGGAADASPGDDVAITDSGADTEDDASDVEEDTTGEFGDPCTSDVDCASGYCISTEDGRVCTELCAESCPDGYECRTLVNSGGDAVRICVPADEISCSPCDEDAECGPIGARCVALGNGEFCAETCGPDRTCAPTYRCENQLYPGAGPGGGDLEVPLCVPVDGTCNAASLGGPGLDPAPRIFSSSRFRLTGRIGPIQHTAQSDRWRLSGAY